MCGTMMGYATIILTKKVVIVLNLISCENNKNKSKRSAPMITLVRQLTLIIATASALYVTLAIVLYKSLVRKPQRGDILSISAGLVIPGVVFGATIALSIWLFQDMHNLRMLLPVSSRIARTTLAEILYMPLSASLWAIGSASIMAVLVKKLFFILTGASFPRIIAFPIACSTLAVAYLSIYTGLSSTQKVIISFAAQVEEWSFYANMGLGVLAIILMVALIIKGTYITYKRYKINNQNPG
jgi:hypothetical protein